MDPAVTEALEKPAVRNAVIRMCVRVWDACPKSAPEDYLERKTRTKSMVGKLFRQFGVNPHPAP